jgi:hypothetical protein
LSFEHEFHIIIIGMTRILTGNNTLNNLVIFVFLIFMKLTYYSIARSGIKNKFKNIKC